MSDTREPRARLARRALLILVALAAVALAVAVLLGRKPPPTAASAIQARLELAAGDVVVVHPSLGGADGVRASSGAPLFEGSTVRAGEGARALVRLPDGSTLFLRAGTTLKLLAASVELVEGEYWLDLPPAEREPLAHVAGDTAVSAADAAMSIARKAENVEIYVARGTAVVTAKGGRVEVQAGTRATSKAGAAPEVLPVAFWEDWTGGMADVAGGLAIGAGSGALFGIDAGGDPGSAAQRLHIKSQSVRAVIKNGLAETSVDQTFFNPTPRPLEGWYWFTVPAGASVTGFAVETNGVLVEGEFVEQKEAAEKYVGARAAGFSPAILEWVDGRNYRARIYPVPASGSRRVVVRYLELRPVLEKKFTYVYPLGRARARIGELSLAVELGEEGKNMKLATVSDARVEDGGTRVTMRRSGFTPRADFQLEATLAEDRPTLSVARFSANDGSADYVMARYVPDVDWGKVKSMPADVVLVADTSAAGDESQKQLQRAAIEALARSLSDKDRFALVALDVRPRVLYPEKGLAPATEAEIAKALEALAGVAPGGATDLAAMFEPSLARLHESEQPAVVYVGDGLPTSGEATGEALAERLRRALSTSRARLFTVGVGADADHALLDALARTGGGRPFRIARDADATPAALELAAAIKEPTITGFSLELGAGLDEPFVSASGKVSRGDDVTVLARTHHEIPSEVTVRGRLAGESFEKKAKVTIDRSLVAKFVPRLWASEYVRRLLGAAGGPETERGRIVSLGIDYGIVTPFSSLLALDNEASYSRMNIQRKRSVLRGVRLGSLTPQAELREPFEHAPSEVAFGCNKYDARRAGGEPDDTEAQPMEGAQAPASTASPAPQAAQPQAAEGERVESKTDGGQREGSGAKPAEGRDEASAKSLADADGEPAGSPPVSRSPSLGGRARGDVAEDRVDAPAPPQGNVAGLGARDGDVGGLGKKTGTGSGFGSGQAREKNKEAGQAWHRPSPPVVAPSVCSDVAARPLEQRLPVWRRRIRTATTAAELIERHHAAVRACEVTDWLAEREFLRILQLRVSDEATARALLVHLAPRRDVQKFVARLILRRVTDERVIAAVETALFGGSVDWLAVDRGLTELAKLEERIEKLRDVMERAPGDPNGVIRMVRLLANAGRSDEALALGRGLRDSGVFTVRMARQLGDVLARAKNEDEAIRTYSEIVEFDPQNLGSRRLLGDIYLARGWHELAYRQCKTATELVPSDAASWLRLAASAAGAGRVDEALRLERQVAASEGRPGPDDPRRFARLASAARLARLLDKPPTPQSAASIERELRELGLFTGPGALALLTWEDLSSELVLTSDDAAATAVGEATAAATMGLAAFASATPPAPGRWVGRLRTEPRDEDLLVRFHELRFDNRRFTVAVREVTLPAGATRIEL